jgi:hypothetical protein
MNDLLCKDCLVLNQAPAERATVLYWGDSLCLFHFNARELKRFPSKHKLKSKKPNQ